ncbi:hypothetical protein [Pseudothauera lacus]|uniref:Uncharacterized protein n=1 Tax=Pseudothauera lacus TaxID=2136175 RepID=A0A2T4IHV7_9RHOO|nr:hypothetical protein [Pseudothauera lacus]PTD97340.1 hypothetical protein C8261_04865 [Pseudothauera lacus]
MSADGERHRRKAGRPVTASPQSHWDGLFGAPAQLEPGLSLSRDQTLVLERRMAWPESPRRPTEQAGTAS